MGQMAVSSRESLRLQLAAAFPRDCPDYSSGFNVREAAHALYMGVEHYDA